MLTIVPDVEQVVEDIYIEHIQKGKGVGLNYRIYPLTPHGGDIYTDTGYIPTICFNNNPSTAKTLPIINLVSSRIDKFKSGNTGNAMNVFNYLKNDYSPSIGVPDLILIREYPIPIDNPNVWKKYVIKEFKNDLNNLDFKFLNRSFISLDVYSPQQKLAIEADSSKYHSGINERKDWVRDRYLEDVVGIDTIRIMDFIPSSEYNINEFKKKLDNYKINKTKDAYYPEPKKLASTVFNYNNTPLVKETVNYIRNFVYRENHLEDKPSNNLAYRILSYFMSLELKIKFVGESLFTMGDYKNRARNFLMTVETIINKTIKDPTLEFLISDEDVQYYIDCNYKKGILKHLIPYK